MLRTTFAVRTTVTATAVALAATAATLLAGGSAGSAPSGNVTGWQAGWGAAMQQPVAGNEDDGPNWSTTGFAAGQSLTQTLRLSGGEGDRLRLRVSNAHGDRPLRLASVTVGRAAGHDGTTVWPGSERTLTFGGRTAAVVAPGRELLSDGVPYTTSPLEQVTVKLTFAAATGPATFHRFTTGTAHRSDGGTTRATYFLKGVETHGTRRDGGLVLFGDSLVDGTGTTPGADNRVPDEVAERLRGRGVVNAGIAGNQLLADSPCFGDKGIDRFKRDVLDRPGVRAAVIHLGANDIAAAQLGGGPCMAKRQVTAAELIEGHRKLIRAAHAKGVKAIGATVTPMKGALFPVWSPEGEKVRGALNEWIRNGGEYDEVLDVDRAMADPSDPELPRAGYVYMDGLHPNDAGAAAIAAALG
ncbi:SGNH/GDSL hydrolase family protein [Streptomyces sp. NPDC050504]|uniref:SGNH/GDSL hydrolase family protein n=1 Tax=Streptomyces sp. NPDC050504 TaxID=3365618 RepID=UPI0037A6E5F3